MSDQESDQKRDKRGMAATTSNQSPQMNISKEVDHL